MKHMKKQLLSSLVLISILFPNIASSQDSLANNKPIFTFSQLTVVYNSSSVEMKRAWSGGLRSPQFNEIDVNGDGIKDLLVFDRYDNSTSIFTYDNGEYIYQPDYEYFFPELTNWVLLRDYNCDGKNDIFTASALSERVQVWTNTTATNSSLTFTQNAGHDVLSTSSDHILINSYDVPDISDIDNDGDLDILAFGTINPNPNLNFPEDYIVYYKNKSVENGGGCDLEYEIYTQCWGHIRQDSSTVTLGDGCMGYKPSKNQSIDSAQNTVLHSGALHSLLALDTDGDGDKELIVGNTQSDNLELLRNGGNLNDALIDSLISDYPFSNPVDMYTYNASFMIDKDKDGDLDLIVSPAEGNALFGKNNKQNLYYENTSTTTVPNFQYRQNDFITDGAIEVGAGAAPKLYDYDYDGDLDLFISNFAYKNDSSSGESKITLYENIGDIDNPIFQLIDTNYANITSNILSEFGKIITFADLDNDGDDDLLIGLFSGKLKYYENSAGAGNKGVYTLYNDIVNGVDYQGIDIGNNAAPELVDYDRDGDFDLIVGEQNGNVNYFENIGTPFSPIFNQVTDSLGMISPRNIYRGYSVPTITDLNGNGNYDLIVGGYDYTEIYMDVESYPSLKTKYSTQDNTYFNSVTENYSNLQFKDRMIPTLGDLDNDGFPEMLVGVYRGGIYYLQNNSDSLIIANSIGENEDLNIKIYPNPTTGMFIVELPSNLENYTISVINTIGQQCLFDKNINNNIVSINLQNNTNGLFYIVIENENKIIYRSKISVFK